jgi:hypothetical protein
MFAHMQVEELAYKRRDKETFFAILPRASYWKDN